MAEIAGSDVLLRHFNAVAELLTAIDHFARAYGHAAEDELTIQLLGVRLFNNAAGAAQSLTGGYYQNAVILKRDLLEAVVTAKRDKALALKILKRIMKTYGRPQKIVTDGLRAYSAAMKGIGNADRQEVGRGLNNRAENSHQPFRRRERAMQRFT